MKRARIMMLGLGILCLTAFGSGTSIVYGQQDDVAALKKEIEVLKKRVAQLEQERQTPSVPGSALSQQRPYAGRSWHEWDPFAEMDRMQAMMDRMFKSTVGRFGGGRGILSNQIYFNPNFDLKETKDGYEIRIDLTGLDKNKIDIRADKHSITIKGEQEREEKNEGDNTYYEMRSYGSFLQTIPLPMDADVSKMKTEKKGNALIIRLPKKA